jgi:hypothetical protein
MDYEPDFLRHIFPRIQWAALVEAATAMGERGRRQGLGRDMGQAPLRWQGPFFGLSLRLVLK